VGGVFWKTRQKRRLRQAAGGTRQPAVSDNRVHLAVKKMEMTLVKARARGRSLSVTRDVKSE
jgi:hypothetical protein